MEQDLIISVAYAFALGWAIGFFTEVIADHFQAEENEAL